MKFLNLREKSLIRKMRKEGFTTSEIAKKIGCSQSNTIIYCKKVKMSPKGKKIYEKKIKQNLDRAIKRSANKCRLSNQKIKKIKQMRKKGKTIYEIANKVDCNHNTAWRYSRNIIMTKKGKKRLEKRIYDHKVKIAKKGGVAAFRSGKLKNAWEVSTKKISKQGAKPPLEKIRLISHIMFDGTLHDYGIAYYNNNDFLIKEVESDIKKVYNLESKIKRKNKLFTLRCHSKQVTEDLLKYTPSFSTSEGTDARIPNCVMKGNSLIKKTFLRAFWDDEGCIIFNPDKQIRELIAYTSNKQVMEQLKDLHKDFSIEFNTPRSNELRISRLRNIKIFADKINFSQNVKITSFSKRWGNRTKRDILQLALESYIRY